jgi:hypothetical protein
VRGLKNGNHKKHKKGEDEIWGIIVSFRRGQCIVAVARTKTPKKQETQGGSHFGNLTNSM